MNHISNARIEESDIQNGDTRALILKVLEVTGGLTSDVLRTITEVSEQELESCLKILGTQNAVRSELREHSKGMRVFYCLTDSYLNG